MIDTVRLIFDAGTFVILEPERFRPNAKTILSLEGRISSGVIKAVFNPKARDTLDGGYAPRLTLRRRPPDVTELVVEFSIPKLLYGNNFDEFAEADFKAVLKALASKLADMGVYIFAELLRTAPVGAIHYGKNIVLPRHLLCSSVIRQLSKVSVPPWLDTSKVEFRNDGHMYKVHTNSFELAFYDKVKDLQKASKSERRSYENDNDIQMDLFRHGELATTLQVLRMEARLNTRSQIQRLLRAINYPDDDLRFFALFRQDIAQKALLYYWQPYQSALPLVTMAQREKPASLMGHLTAHDLDATMGTHLQRLGAMMLIGEVGWNGLRTYWQGCDKGFHRLKKDLQTLPPVDPLGLCDWQAIETTLQRFEPVKIESHLSGIPLSNPLVESSRLCS